MAIRRCKLADSVSLCARFQFGIVVDAAVIHTLYYTWVQWCVEKGNTIKHVNALVFLVCFFFGSKLSRIGVMINIDS